MRSRSCRSSRSTSRTSSRARSNTPGTLQLLALCLVFGGLALSYDLLFGFTGLLSFGHALYFAVGVYVAAIAITTLALGLRAPSVALHRARRRSCSPLVLGAVSLRVGGIAFAMVTLAFAQAGSILAFKNPYKWTGGEEGFGVDYHKLPDLDVVGIFNTKTPLLDRARLRGRRLRRSCSGPCRSSPGHVWQAIRENELRVAGARPAPVRVQADVVRARVVPRDGRRRRLPAAARRRDAPR